MRSRSERSRSTAVALAALLVAVFLPAAAAAQPFNCLPSCAADDGRFLAIAAGAGFVTLSDPTLDLTFIVPAGTASFDIGIFDGDFLGTSGPGGHWDSGTVGDFQYTLFADPDADVTGTVAVLGPLAASTFSDNDWDDFTIATGPEAQSDTGDYVYRLRVELLDPLAASCLNVFKVRTSSIAALEPIAQPFGYIANITDPSTDIPIVFPNCAGNFPGCLGNPTTISTSNYDGSFTFFIEAQAAQSMVSVWDGDFDRGDAAGTNLDTDDANTPGTPFEPVFSTVDTVPEGIALGSGLSTGSPPDDTGFFLRRRSPSIFYDLIAPDGQVFHNDNPSGNQEWELFKVSTEPLDITADVITSAGLPAGSYQLAIQGVDMANLNFVLTPFRILCVKEDGTSCDPPSRRELFEVGDTVFEDIDGDGFQDAGEPGIQGVIVRLLGSAGNAIATTVTGADGNYSFTVAPDTYTVEVAGENFAVPAPSGAVGDRVWLDVNGDGDDENGADPGIANVILHLFDPGPDGTPDPAGDPTPDDVLLAVTETDANGYYLFRGLAAGTYFVDVVDFSVPDGLSLVTTLGATDPSATTTIAAGGVDLELDFPYGNSDGGTAIIGDFVWNDSGIDTDGDGIADTGIADGVQDPGEAGISGVTLELIDVSNPLDPVKIAETRTGVDGSYLFTGVPAGDYEVRVTDTALLLSGYALTFSPDGAGSGPTATLLGVTAGDVLLGADFGYHDAGLFSITDVVWLDADRNGELNGAEAGIVGVTVNLVDGQGMVIATTTTLVDGSFAFLDLPDGQYGLVITDLAGELAALLPTTIASAAGSQSLILAGEDVDGIHFGWVDTGVLTDWAGTTIKDPDGDVNRQIDTVVDQDILDYDFGYALLSFVGNRVWKDENGDGFQDAGEPGLNGVVVTLLDANGDVVESTTTGGDGEYLFDELLPGEYTLVVDAGTLPDGLQPTYDYDDANATEPILTPNEARVTLIAGEGNLDVDFGYDDCGECQGKVSQLTLQYLGSEAAHIEVIAKRGKNLDPVFDDTVQPGASFTLTPPDNDATKKGFAGTLGTEIRIYVDGVLHTAIHTSCSKPIGPGLVSGDFLVVWGASREGGLLCPVDGGDPGGVQCSACSGKVTWLTLRYTGENPAFITVTQRRPADEVFSNLVQVGEEIYFSGTDGKGTLGTEISVVVDGVETRVHTSCSVPIGPGLHIGEFLEVIGGASRNGGLLCPL